MNIRKATHQDIKELAKLAESVWKASFGDGLNPKGLAEEIEKNRSEIYFNRVIGNHLVLLAAISDKIVGFIEIGSVTLPIANASSNDRELIKLYVDISFQGRGIGAQLIDAAFSDSELNNVSNVYLDVWEKNIVAIRLYQNYGFQVIGEHYPAFGNDPDLIMVRKLFEPENLS